MKTFFSTACLASALMMFASCGGTKKTASAPSGIQEFDQATGSWKAATKIVQPPPHQESAPLPKISSQVDAEPGHRSFMQKAGDTMKKPLHWVGLGKDKEDVPPPPSATASAKPKAKAIEDPSVVNRPPLRSPIEPKPGHESLWKRIGDAIKKPFHRGGSDSSNNPS